MGALIGGTVVVILAVIAAVVAIYFRRKQGRETALERGWATKGDLNRRQERLLIEKVNSADIIFRQLLAPSSDLVGEITLLSRDHRAQVEAWLIVNHTLSPSETRRIIEES